MPPIPIPDPSFLDRCLSGDALIEDIDDYIDDWHQGDSDQSLHEFLGMTRDEYRFWVKDPNCLPYIVSARVRGCVQRLSDRDRYREIVGHRDFHAFIHKRDEDIAHRNDA